MVRGDMKMLRELTRSVVTGSTQELKSAQEMCFIVQVKESSLLDLFVRHPNASFLSSLISLLVFLNGKPVCKAFEPSPGVRRAF